MKKFRCIAVSSDVKLVSFILSLMLVMTPCAHAGKKVRASVKVPDITGGSSGCVMDVDAILRPLGLKSKKISSHGPDSSDAKDPGCAYHQSPKPGTVVKKGSVVRYHTWWESQ